MGSVWAIAQMTFLEARRNKITWSLLLFCIVIVLTSFVFQEVTVVAYDRILRDVALGAINSFGVLLSIFLGVSVVSREIERRTVYMLLSKPLGRGQYLLGKLLGVWLTLVVSLGLMLVAFLAENALFRAPLALVIFQAFWLMLVELLVLASFSLLASTFTSSIMSAFMAIGLFLIGHLSSHLYFFSYRSKSPFVKSVGTALYYALPDLERLNLKTQASLLSAVPMWKVGEATLYGLVFAGGFFALAVALFARRDLK